MVDKYPLLTFYVPCVSSQGTLVKCFILYSTPSLRKYECIMLQTLVSRHHNSILVELNYSPVSYVQIFLKIEL